MLKLKKSKLIFYFLSQSSLSKSTSTVILLHAYSTILYFIY